MKSQSRFVVRAALGMARILVGILLFHLLSQQSVAASSEAIPEKYFGLTIHRLISTPWPSIHFGSLRLWDAGVQWVDINIAPGEYRWSDLDSIMTLAQDHGVDLVYTFGRTPQWASAAPNAPTGYAPGQCAPPSNIQYWDDFVRAIVARAAGRIKYWEVWNEPQDSRFYCGDIATLIMLQQHTYNIIKSIDSSLMVLTPSPVSPKGPQWMSEFLKLGGGQYADILAFHGYPSRATTRSPESIVAISNDFKSIFAANHQGSKPVWDTEASWGWSTELPDPDLQAAFVAKYYLLHWSAGVQRFYWFSYENDKKWGTLWEWGKGLLKPGLAYQEVSKWMIGALMDVPCTEVRYPTGIFWTCSFSRPNGYKALAIWHTSGPKLFIAPNNYIQYRDLTGTVTKLTARKRFRVGNEPILLESESAF